MQHEAARPKGRSYDNEPTQQPMRPVLRGQIARNPSTDQKKARRANMRKSADFNESGAAWVPGHVSCQSCGYKGHPRLGDTGPECGACGSYSVTKHKAPVGPDNSRYLAAADPNAYLDSQCPGCGGPANSRNPEGTCNGCMPEVRSWTDRREDDDRARETNDGRHASKTATVLDTRAEMLNPGDQIAMPNGRTQKVTRVRPHETSAKHVYVDTDAGTALVERSSGFQVAPKNSRQQALPGYGTPGGNSNTLPFDPQTGGSNAAPSSKCPNCGGSGTLMRKGDHYVCSRCGYAEQFGGAGGATFSDASSVVRTFSTVNQFTPAVARRAAALLATTKETHS